MPILCALGNQESRCDQHATGNEKRQFEIAEVEHSTSYHTRNEYKGVLERNQYSSELLVWRTHLERAYPCTTDEVTWAVGMAVNEKNSHIGWRWVLQKSLFVICLEHSPCVYITESREHSTHRLQITISGSGYAVTWKHPPRRRPPRLSTRHQDIHPREPQSDPLALLS